MLNDPFEDDDIPDTTFLIGMPIFDWACRNQGSFPEPHFDPADYSVQHQRLRWISARQIIVMSSLFKVAS